jgi:hypothetical protein
LLLLMLLTLVVLSPPLAPASHAADQCSDAGTDRGSLTGIATDSSSNRTDRRATSRATEKPAPRRFDGRRRYCSLCRTRWVVSSLLLRPSMTLISIAVELFLALSFGWIDIELLCGYVTCRAQTHQSDNDLPHISFHFCYSPDGAQVPTMNATSSNFFSGTLKS